MKKNRIELIFDKEIVCLVGNPFGYSVYQEQIKCKFDYGCINIIVFPEQINRVAISFMQGMMRDLLKKIPKNEILSRVEFEASSKALVERIKERVVF